MATKAYKQQKYTRIMNTTVGVIDSKYLFFFSFFSEENKNYGIFG